MKRVLLFVLTFCLMLSFSVQAEGLSAKDAETCAAIQAFLTGDPELTPAQAEAALGFLAIVYSPLEDVLRNKDDETVLNAFSLLIHIRDRDPALRQLITDQRAVLDDSGEALGTYVLNIRSNRFHRPGCTGLAEMSEKNRVNFTGSRGILLATGFQPCQMCKP